MAKILTYFPIYLPSQGQFQGMDGDTSHSVRYWLNREICNSAGGAFDAPDTLAAALGSGRCSHLRRNAMTFVAN